MEPGAVTHSATPVSFTQDQEVFAKNTNIILKRCEVYVKVLTVKMWFVTFIYICVLRSKTITLEIGDSSPPGLDETHSFDFWDRNDT